jgi:deoxyadenosine/deoxycytidine kinase
LRRRAEFKMDKNVMETWKIFMKLCEEFPELYENYVQKVEREIKSYNLDFKITEEDKEQVWKQLQERIKKDT